MHVLVAIFNFIAATRFLKDVTFNEVITQRYADQWFKLTDGYGRLVSAGTKLL